MSDIDYMQMLEVPISSCDVVIKPKKRRKKDIKEVVIDKVNNSPTPEVSVESEENVSPYASVEVTKKTKRQVPKLSFKKPTKTSKSQRVEPVNTRSVKVKSSHFDIVSVQVVAIFVLIVGIILTNIFWEDSGMNNLLKTVFGSQENTVSSATYSSFTAYAPTKSEEVFLEDGVMTIEKGSVYAPCDGQVEDIKKDDETGLFTVTIRHSNSFTSVFSGLMYNYLQVGDSVYTNIPIGYSDNATSVSLFDSGNLLTKYSILDDMIVWLN